MDGTIRRPPSKSASKQEKPKQLPATGQGSQPPLPTSYHETAREPASRDSAADLRQRMASPLDIDVYEDDQPGLPREHKGAPPNLRSTHRAQAPFVEMTPSAPPAEIDVDVFEEASKAAMERKGAPSSIQGTQSTAAVVGGAMPSAPPATFEVQVNNKVYDSTAKRVDVLVNTPEDVLALAEALMDRRVGWQAAAITFSDEAPDWAGETVMKAILENQSVISLGVAAGKFAEDIVLRTCQVVAVQPRIRGLTIKTLPGSPKKSSRFAEVEKMLKRNTTLEALKLFGIQPGFILTEHKSRIIESRDVVCLKNGLVNNKTLKAFCLDGCPLNAKDLLEFSEILKKNATLTSLTLRRVFEDIDPSEKLTDSIKKFVSALKQNKSINEVDFSSNQIGPETAKLFAPLFTPDIFGKRPRTPDTLRLNLN